jgi:hypothetical protein
MGTDETNQEEVLAVELIEGSSEIAGAAVGATIGLIGGPAGAVGGAAGGALLARVLRRVGADLRQRVLGPREELRVGAAAAHAGAMIQILLDAGKQPRDDGFFDAPPGERPAAEELLEGVLLQARDAYEEKKVRLLGIMYAQLAFHPEISAPTANHLLSLAERLTYRQLVVMVIAQGEGNRELLRDGNYRGDAAALDAFGGEGAALLIEIYDIYQRGLLSDAHGSAWISVADVDPRAMRLQGSASTLAGLMGLATIPMEDRAPIYAMLA